MKISFPFVACVRTAGRKKICLIVAVQFLLSGLGPFRGPDAPRALKTNNNSSIMAKSTAAWPLNPRYALHDFEENVRRFESKPIKVRHFIYARSKRGRH
jgi:hypothetical protein